MATRLYMPGLCLYAVIVVVAVCWFPTPGSCVSSGVGTASSFYVIKNSSLPCLELATVAPNLQRVVLSDDDMMELFRSKGGVYNPAYMARSQEEADRHFINLIDIPKRFKEQVMVHKAIERVQHQRVTRGDILSYIRQLARERFQEEQQQQEEEEEEGQTSEQRPRPERHPRPERLGRRRHRRTPEQGCNRRQLEEDAFPLVLPNELGIAETYASGDGSQTNITFCHCRGSYADPSEETKILCTTCSATTTVDNQWPPQLNEALCHSSDKDCLEIQGIAQGLCRQNSMEITVLCKKEGFCVLAIEGGQTVIADEWETCYQVINTGCECTVYDHSFLSPFV